MKAKSKLEKNRKTSVKENQYISSGLLCALFVLVKELCIDGVLLVSLNAKGNGVHIKYRFFPLATI